MVMSEGMLRMGPIRGTYVMDRKGGAFDQRRPSWLSKAALLTSQSCCPFWSGLLADLGVQTTGGGIRVGFYPCPLHHEQSWCFSCPNKPRWMVDSKIPGLYQDESSPSGGFDWNLDMKECEANIKKLDDEHDKLHEILANASIDGYIGKSSLIYLIHSVCTDQVVDLFTLNNAEPKIPGWEAIKVIYCIHISIYIYIYRDGA